MRLERYGCVECKKVHIGRGCTITEFEWMLDCMLKILNLPGFALHLKGSCIWHLDSNIYDVDVL